MSKAIIWCRVSTDKQEWETQRNDLLAEARKDGFREEDNNVIIIGEAGASAIKMNELYQKEVNELISKINSSSDVSTIYVWEVSRLARNELAFAQMKDTLISKKIQLICKVPEIKLFDSDGEVNKGAEVTLSLLITLARQEMDIKKKRFARGKKELARQGKYNGGAIPYGYRIDKENDNRIVIDEKESAIVREIYDMYENGFSQMAIAKELYSRGVKGKSVRRNDLFTLSLVHQILTNELLTGEPHKSKGASYERSYPQIITVEQFNHCREIAKKNLTELPKPRRVYYATGLIECTSCKHRFSSSGEKGYYRCRYATLRDLKYDGYRGEMCSNKLHISVNIIDSLLWQVASLWEATAISEATESTLHGLEQRYKNTSKKLENIPILRKEITNKIERNEDVYIERGDKERYIKKRQELQKELRELEKQEVQFKQDIDEINRLIEECKRNLGVKDSVKDKVISTMNIFNQVKTITDDKERYNIIHRQVNKVTVEETKYNYKFGIHPNGKDAKARLITIYPKHLHTIERFMYIPFNGKGGTMLSQKRKYSKKEKGFSLVENEFVPFPFNYMERVVDRKKISRRTKESEERDSMQRLERTKMRDNGYISMPEMQEAIQLSYSTIYNYIKKEKLHGEKVGGVWFVKKKEFEEFCKTYNPLPRKENKTR